MWSIAMILKSDIPVKQALVQWEGVPQMAHIFLGSGAGGKVGHFRGVHKAQWVQWLFVVFWGCSEVFQCDTMCFWAKIVCVIV